MSGNQLGQETSPYLLQHADNPVHWRPWSQAALDEAKAAGKPVLLSVGYAACHWCHVMAHESFEDAETAAVMNDLFINIKVDREERPDVDAIYMSALQLMGQRGGWPLTMFLTPDGEPFWGGTYFPKDSAFGRPGFKDVLRQVADAYHQSPEKVSNNTGALVDALRKGLNLPQSSEPPAALALPVVDQLAESLAGHVDPEWGGLRGAPKFPVVFAFDALWRSWHRTGRQELHDAVLLTLDRLCQGGIYDHLGGGFARYSTDAQWLVPHFEKMLYDNAQLIDLMTSVWQETRSPLLQARVEETVDWLEREMIAENGAFASSLDADTEGEEGRFYVWTKDEIDRVLGTDADAALFKRAYDVRPGGNWEGKTVLNRNFSDVGDEPALETKLYRARMLLLRERDKRVMPGRDDKVLADWNGLMIHALARAGAAFGRPEWVDLARSAYDGIRDTMSRPGDRLGHSFRKGRLQDVAMLDDYANMARAALTLHQVTGVADFIDHASRWVAVLDAEYWDDAAGGYFLTAADATDLILRTKSAQDNATPSGNGTMAVVLATLWHLTGEERYRRRAIDLIEHFRALALNSYPHGATLLHGFEVLEDAVQVVIAGTGSAAGALAEAALDAPAPGLILQRATDPAALPQSHPAHGKTPVDGQAAAYVCRGTVCSAPVTDAEDLRAQLAAR
ncbi:thioredoxin domain-containing protein [Caenispirillum salinarum]